MKLPAVIAPLCLAVLLAVASREASAQTAEQLAGQGRLFEAIEAAHREGGNPDLLARLHFVRGFAFVDLASSAYRNSAAYVAWVQKGGWDPRPGRAGAYLQRLEKSNSVALCASQNRDTLTAQLCTIMASEQATGADPLSAFKRHSFLAEEVTVASGQFRIRYYAPTALRVAGEIDLRLATKYGAMSNNPSTRLMALLAAFEAGVRSTIRPQGSVETLLADGIAARATNGANFTIPRPQSIEDRAVSAYVAATLWGDSHATRGLIAPLISQKLLVGSTMEFSIRAALRAGRPEYATLMGIEGVAGARTAGLSSRILAASASQQMAASQESGSVEAHRLALDQLVKVQEAFYPALSVLDLSQFIASPEKRLGPVANN